MEKKSMGSFMAALRKANGLTQQQVADKLNVSNKTISKWECNEGYPEITMLPAIAELFSVSVDELLRGERIAKTTSTDSVDSKNREQVKYLIERTLVKFTNNAIISIVLGAVALVLAYTICDIVYDYNVLWIGYMIILLLCGVSVAITLVAFNNFTSRLNNEDIVEKEATKGNTKKCIKYITVVAFLAIVTLLGLICDVIFDAPSFLFVALPATAVIGFVIAYVISSHLHKRFEIAQTGLSPEQKLYRKKHIKTTSIILAVVVLATLLLPFAFAWYETSEHTTYSFSDGVGYQYESKQEAETEYNKLKDYVTGKKTLYYINYEDYSEDTGEYILYVEPMRDVFEYSESGYNMVETKPTAEEELRFKNLEDAEKFKEENVCDDENAYNLQQKNLVFDDETLSVIYQSGDVNTFSGVLDILPAFIIIGSCVFIAVFIASVAIYYRNKKARKKGEV